MRYLERGIVIADPAKDGRSRGSSPPSCSLSLAMPNSRCTRKAAILAEHSCPAPTQKWRRRLLAGSFCSRILQPVPRSICATSKERPPRFLPTPQKNDKMWEEQFNGRSESASRGRAAYVDQTMGRPMWRPIQASFISLGFLALRDQKIRRSVEGPFRNSQWLCRFYNERRLELCQPACLRWSIPPTSRTSLSSKKVVKDHNQTARQGMEKKPSPRSKSVSPRRATTLPAL